MTWRNFKSHERFAASWGVACFAGASALAGYTQPRIMLLALYFIIGIYAFAVVRDLLENIR